MAQFYGYDDCIELTNTHARVVLTPHGGCRVLVYALTGGPNAIHLDDGASGLWESGDDAGGEKHEGWKWQSGTASTGDPFGPTGGRFDVGPEFQSTGPNMQQGGHPALFFGSWAVQSASGRSCKMISPVCELTGLQLSRSFDLADESADLRVSQTMRNQSTSPSLRVSHWGRTFVPGGGVALVPLPTDGYSRFPKKYVTYSFTGEHGPHMLFQPPDGDNIRERGNFIEITPHRRMRHEKIGMDSTAGWMGYVSPLGNLLIKRFAVDPSRAYGEMAGLTCCVFYYRDRLVELEPIGPLENLGPGEEATFVEDWSLMPFDFPAEGEGVDLGKLSELVAGLRPVAPNL